MMFRSLFGLLVSTWLACSAHSQATQPGVTDLEPQQFFDMASSGAFRAIIDVRTSAEWDLGHIQNATLLDSLQNANTSSEIATVADLYGCEYCPLVVYCRSGQRAAAALEKLVLAGFQGPLYNGLGVNQWTEAGYELVTTASVEPPCKTTTTSSRQGGATTDGPCPKPQNTLDDPSDEENPNNSNAASLALPTHKISAFVVLTTTALTFCMLLAQF